MTPINCPKPVHHKHGPAPSACPPRVLPVADDLALIPMPQVLVKYLPAPSPPCVGAYTETAIDGGIIAPGYWLGGGAAHSMPEIDPGSAGVGVTVLLLMLAVMRGRQ